MRGIWTYATVVFVTMAVVVGLFVFGPAILSWGGYSRDAGNTTTQVAEEIKGDLEAVMAALKEASASDNAQTDALNKLVEAALKQPASSMTPEQQEAFIAELQKWGAQYAQSMQQMGVMPGLVQDLIEEVAALRAEGGAPEPVAEDVPPPAVVSPPASPPAETDVAENDLPLAESNPPVEEIISTNGHTVADVEQTCHGLDVEFPVPFEEMVQEQLKGAFNFCEGLRYVPETESPAYLAVVEALEAMDW